MLFHSIVFLSVFLPVVFAAYTLVRGQRNKNILLIIANLVFYAYGQAVYVALLFASAVFHYFIGRVVTGKLKKIWLIVCVIADVLVLFLFKYLAFAVDILNKAAGTSFTALRLAMPVGISFFTFQALSYVIDAYRDPEQSERNFGDVLLYITLFPQLLAGPIIRFKDIKAEIRSRETSWDDVADGIRRFILGLSKKVILADTVAKVANGVFALSAGDLNVMSAWLGAIAYTLQIYFDFSGYSDMAIGLAEVFGFHYKENFHFPYAAIGIKDFWRRWHISLSSWFRDYLYIPLGGNRKGKKRTVLNKFIVFFVTGLWHGANWTFIVWGLAHGTCAVIEDGLRSKFPAGRGIVWKRVLTMVIVITTFAIFRADSLGQAFLFIGKMFAGFSVSAASRAAVVRLMTPFTIFACALAVLFSFPILEKSWRIENKSAGARVLWNAAALFLFLFSMAMISSGGYSPFIYFKF